MIAMRAATRAAAVHAVLRRRGQAPTSQPGPPNVHLMLTFRLNSRPLQQRIEGMERRTSVRETSHDILYEPRTRAARACIAAGVPVASSCIPSCAVCVADRTPVGPQIVFASPPCPRRYAAGLTPPRPGRRAIWRRLRGGLGRRRRRRWPLARASTRCCVGPG